MSFVHDRGAKDFYEAQIEILKKEMQLYVKGVYRGAQNLPEGDARIYQNSQL